MTILIRPPIAPTDSKDLQTELKYVAPLHRAKLALRILDKICSLDDKHPIGIVSSIYYDTVNWDLLREKRDSDYLKAKIRLRWYETSEGISSGIGRSYAEAKYRIGSRRLKFRIPTDIHGDFLSRTTLTAPELRNVPDQLSARGAPIKHRICPAFVVRYHRCRYVDRLTGARISLDYKIGAPKTNPMMIAAPHPCNLPVTVLEVKGTDGVFPNSLRSLLKLGFRKEAFSKYYECYGQLSKTFF